MWTPQPQLQHRKKMNKHLCFDVGANVGTKTRELLALGFEHVVAVEPLFDSPFPPEEKRVTWVKSLVSNSFEPRMIYPLGTISTVETSFMEGRFKGQVWGAPVQVKSTTLAALMEIHGYPDYIKIDVEGHELSVLKGLPSQACTDLISFEWHSEQRELAQACVDHMKSIGFSRFQLNFEDSIIDLHTINCTGTAEDVMADFDTMCEVRHLPWGQIFCQL
jgi:hypothetical protein